jgi:pimeloyl-ACP methyl ester carboxylesterase
MNLLQSPRAGTALKLRVVASLDLPGWLTAGWGSALAVLLLAGCVAPIGADRVTTRRAYAQIEGNALRSGKPSADTVAILHRYDLDRLAIRHPDEAVRQLHQKALATGERDLLFALAELSYAAGDHIRRGVKPWDPRDARDYYLGSAVYAWLFLFGDGKEARPGPFDRRIREACDFYNYSLGLALKERKSTNGVVQLQDVRRRLPVGELEIRLTYTNLPHRLEDFEQILLADEFRVRGLSVRNREPGIGAPLICVRPLDLAYSIHFSSPATVLLRGPASLAELGSRNGVYSMEVYPAFNGSTVAIGDTRVPLEVDLTTHRAYTLRQSTIWKLGNLQFLAPAERLPSQLMLNQDFDPRRIPVVFVHGTFSSPVTWAEMANTLIADPVLRQRYQIWSFIYGSGNPLIYSVAEFRAALADRLQQLDPAGTNAMLRQMVIIGHSQGGLLTKGTAIDVGDRIWHAFSTNRLEDLKVNDAQRAAIRRLLFLKPLPFVSRVVFIATPHRGSYLAGGLARRWAHRLVSLPGALVARLDDLLRLAAGAETEAFFRGKTPTSLDGMSPKNPGLLVMSKTPVAPSIKAHSIVAVKGGGDYAKGRDGLVTYESAHQDYVESEFIVRSHHSCLDQPATIEEVRRILHRHLKELE